MAQTRHYRDRVAVPPAPGYQTTMPPGDDTSRFYYPQTAPPRYTVPPPQGSSSSFWLVMALLGVLVVSGLAGAIATNIRVNGRRPRPVSPEAIEAKIQEQAEKQAEQFAKEIEKQAEIIAEQAEIAAKQAQQAASAGIPVPPAPPAPPAPPTNGRVPNAGQGQGLQRLIYPNSKVEGETIFEGTHVIQIRAKAQISDIERFYTQKLGAPPALRKADKLIFDIKNKAEKLVVVVKQDRTDSGEYLIQVIRTP